MDRDLLNDSQATVVDVRTPEEYNAGHYSGAIHIPLDELEKRIDEFNKMHKPIVLYCRSGNRSGIALDFLQKHGITDIYNGGGLSDMGVV